MIDWKTARAFTEEACAEIFDYTELTLHPRKAGLTSNHPDADDPDRVPFDFKGTIDLEPPSDRLPLHQSSDVGVRNGTVSYDAVLTARISDWPYLPRRNDLVGPMGGTPKWKIAAKEEDGSARPAWYLIKA